jgi:hypothetical protein
MAENSSGYQEKSFFGENSYMVIEALKSPKDSSNPEKEFNS